MLAPDLIILQCTTSISFSVGGYAILHFVLTKPYPVFLRELKHIYSVFVSNCSHLCHKLFPAEFTRTRQNIYDLPQPYLGWEKGWQSQGLTSYTLSWKHCYVENLCFSYLIPFLITLSDTVIATSIPHKTSSKAILFFVTVHIHETQCNTNYDRL